MYDIEKAARAESINKLVKGERMKKAACLASFMLLLICILASSHSIRYVKAWWAGDITIKDDGSIDPPGAPVNRSGNFYSLTEGVQGSIVVGKDNIIFDGMGHIVQGIERSGTGIDLSLRTNVTIKNMEIETFDYGIYLASSSQNTVSQTNITDNNDGIYLTESSGNNISKNKVASNIFEGIYLYYSLGNNVTQNIVTANHFDGIYLYSSSRNNVLGNTMTANTFDGVFLDSSTGNNLLANNIENNSVGITTIDSANNRIFNNNFINNTQQAQARSSADVWDNSYPSGGNYWSNYNGTDSYSGPCQNATGSDGIGDTPYVIDGSNQDNYPLMTPHTPHDLAVIHSTTSRTVVGQGYSLNINATVANRGDYTENFNVTAYANTTIIASQNVTLPAGNSATVTFTWNTTGVAYGNYTISAVATLPSDTDPADNTFVDGKILVTISGDIDGDQFVNAKDAIILGKAFGSKRGEVRYTPNADLNGDDWCNAKDAIIIGSNFGQKWP